MSLLQLARAYTVFARDGELLPLTLVKSGALVGGEKVISTEAAHEVRAMLELAVQNGGTGPRARIMGWRVAGKTGTAHLAIAGGYSRNRYAALFCGIVPAGNPRLVGVVVIRDAGGHGGEYFGGLVSAPVFREVMSGALRLLDIPPDNVQQWYAGGPVTPAPPPAPPPEAVATARRAQGTTP